MDFAHLHCRTHYSFLDGAMSPAELVDAVAEAGMTAVAMTDAANLCGLVEFYDACTDKDIKPIFGCELWIGRPVQPDVPAADATTPTQRPAQQSMFAALAPVVEPEPEALADPDAIEPDHQIVLLVENQIGYRNLCALLTLAHRQRCYTPLLHLEQLLKHSEGLICLSSGTFGPIGMLPDQELRERLIALRDNFGTESFFLELIDWGREEDEQRNARVRTWSDELGIDTVVTNSCRYVQPEGTALYSVMRSIATGVSPYDTDHAWSHSTDQATLKSTAEMIELFDCDADAVARAAQISERCTFVPELGDTNLPNSTPPEGTLEEQWAWLLDWFPPPQAFSTYPSELPSQIPDGWDIVDVYFAWYARTGLKVRLAEEGAALQFGTPEQYIEAMEMELGVMQRMKFATYHLIVAEFTNWAKDNGIAVGPGRGSAAGSVVVWALKITDINPLQFGLMFERYLNPKRVSMPDIDMDFEQERREEVLQHVRDKYGEDCVCQILTIGTMKAKAALKDCARACSVHFNEADRWSKQLPDGPKVKLWPSVEENEMLMRLYEGDPKFRNIITVARAIEGRPRQTGVHAAGVIITSRPISEFIPMHCEDGAAMTGVEMNAAEKMGLVKFDFLGLKTLDIIEEACDSVERRTGQRPVPIQPLFDDPGVYELLARGDALGLFQVESDGMQNLLRRMETNSMDDIVAISALYRPGPLASGMVEDYVECKHGRATPTYPHPLLSEVLGPTYGVFVFQEQVMKAAQVLAGFDLSDADLLRRAMGKKKQKEMDAQRGKFIDGCKETNNIDKATATKVFNLIDHFAGYGFNRSHSASYGVITYMTAYLKAHHREDLMAAAMSLEQANREKLVAYVTDCMKAQVPVLSPDINCSQERFSVEPCNHSSSGLAIRYGLGAIKGMGDATLQSLFEARRDRPFVSIDDLQQRGHANKSVLQALICAGALDSIENDRFEAWWTLNRPKAKSALKKKDSRDQVGLLTGRTAGDEDTEHVEQQELAVKPTRWTYSAQLDKEHDVLGCWLSGHPLDRFVDVERRSKTVLVCELENLKRRSDVTLAGVITKIHKIKTRTGNQMTFFTLSDRSGMTEVVLRPRVWEEHKDVIAKGNCVEVAGELDRDGAEGKVIVKDVTLLGDKRVAMATQLELVLEPYEAVADEYLRPIKLLLDRYIVGHKNKGCQLRILVLLEDGTSLKITLPDDPILEIDQGLFNEMEMITGRPNALRVQGRAQELAETDLPSILPLTQPVSDHMVETKHPERCHERRIHPGPSSAHSRGGS